MTEHQVDELLKDLDAALSVEPSPSLVARVRTAIDRQPVVARFWWMRRGVLACAGAAAVAVTTYVVWPRPALSPVPVGTQAANASSETAPAPVPVVTPRAPEAGPTRDIARTPATRTTRPSRPAPPAPEPEVIISPDARLGLAQLAEAMRSGRVTSESFSAGDVRAEPMLVVMTPFAVPQFKVEDLSPKPAAPPTTNGEGPGGGSRDRENAGGR